MTFANPLTAAHSGADFLGTLTTVDPTSLSRVIDVGRYSSIVVVPAILPGTGYAQLAAQFATTPDTPGVFLGDASQWDSASSSGLWVFDVKTQHLTFALTTTSSSNLAFTVYGVVGHLDPAWLDLVGAGVFTKMTRVNVPATGAGGFSSLVPVSARAGQARIVLRGLGPISSNQAWVQPRRLALDPANAIWLSQQGTASDWTDVLTVPTEPVAVAFYSTGAHPLMPVNLVYL